MKTYRYEVSRALGLRDGYVWQLEAFGTCRHSLLSNAYVYLLDGRGNEVSMIRYTELPDDLFSIAIVALRNAVNEAEIAKVYRPM